MTRPTATIVAAMLVVSASPSPAEAPDPRPNVVIILTDDQRWDATWGMPTLQERIIAPGVRFTNAFASNPVCCPSRASLLTGQYAHTSGVWNNFGPHGGFERFDDSSTVATWLSTAGYSTAFVGKYLNEYDGVTIPPGWSHWVAFAEAQGNFYNYDLNRNGAIESYGEAPEDYSTDVLADAAVDYVSEEQDPFLLLFAPYAPHGPAPPAPRHEGAFAGIAKHRTPSFNEKDVTDKPGYVRAFGPMSRATRRSVQWFRRKQLESLLAVDEAIGRILDALGDRISNTLVIFLSDNGVHWGEHRMLEKTTPYNESIRIPLAIRYDALGVSGVESRLAVNIDLAPTVADAAGVAPPATDGRSLLALLRGEVTSWPRRFVVEHVRAPQARGGPAPTYCGVRTMRRLYVRYRSGFEELYDTARDPYEMRNLRKTRWERRWVKRAVRRHRRLARQLCIPRPPGMSSFSAGTSAD